VKVLLLTRAGGEGLNLKGTRYEVIFEKNWNRASEEQVIARGARYKSHSHLPEDKRKVDVYHLLIKKPDNSKGGPSADIRLKNLIEKKEKRSNEFMKKIRPLSIEHKKCA
jgi:hypothetical protein